jgi:hypothetical protein
MEDGEEKEKKKRKEEKITMEKEGFPKTGPNLLTMQRVAAINCN